MRPIQFRILKEGRFKYRPQWRQYKMEWQDCVVLYPTTTLTLWGARRECEGIHKWLRSVERVDVPSVVEEWTTDEG